MAVPALPAAGADQPAHLPLGIDHVWREAGRLAIRSTAVPRTPFVTARELAAEDGAARPPCLVVPPLSGHFSVLMRDLVLGLLPDHRVRVLDWTNARHVPVSASVMAFDDTVAAIAAEMRRLGPGAGAVALCQAGVPALAAAALLAAEAEDAAPAALVLIAAPVDPLARPTPLVRLIRRLPAAWYRTVPVTRVPPPHAGRGRRVYPAEAQLEALRRHLARQIKEGGELAAKIDHDDGADPAHHPFLRLYGSVMDLDAVQYAENIRHVFLERSIMRDRLVIGGRLVAPAALGRTALMTVEGGADPIVAPGQTAAAHALCTGLAPDLKRRLVVPGEGHFALFHGAVWRARVLPEIRRHLASAQGVLAG